MNLIHDPWIPVKYKSGLEKRIAPWQISETTDPVEKLNAPRPDFNGALIQFLIGLLQTAFTPNDQNEWARYLTVPPSSEILKSRFSSVAYAFELNSTGGSFMQDFGKLNGNLVDVGHLLIDFPGISTIEKNRDHFVKHDSVQGMCENCTATALFTLQTNAPSGGRGHRVSIRGGGPLTTLVVPDEQGDLNDHLLWSMLWLNVLELEKSYLLTGNWNLTSSSHIFPWLDKIDNKKKITHIDANPFQMYWGMPRRLKIKCESNKTGTCNICNEFCENFVTHYQTENYGLDYESSAWRHPLTPYKRKGEKYKPQLVDKDGLTYLHWLNLAGHENNIAIVVKRYRELISNTEEQFRLLAFGYEMDKKKPMKPRCWYEKTYPLITVHEQYRDRFVKRVESLTDAAFVVGNFFQRQVENSWINNSQAVKGDSSFLVRAFNQKTENDFYNLLENLPKNIEDGTDIDALHLWYNVLRDTAMNMFDYWATRGEFAQADIKRIVVARDRLKKFFLSKKIKQILQVP